LEVWEAVPAKELIPSPHSNEHFGNLRKVLLGDLVATTSEVDLNH
jgi:hypothetical protein